MTTVYHKWEDVPEGLLTRTQLKAERLKPAPDQKPVAQKRSSRRDVYDLYEKAAAVPMRTLSEAQKAAATTNIEKARQALCCVDCGRQMQRKRELRRGRCDDCQEEHTIKSYRVRAKERFVELSRRDDWLVLDTETTGLDYADEVISVAVVASNGETLFHSLVRPTVRIHPRASAVNGLTDEMVADAAAFADIYPRLVEAMAGRLVLAYNADFDKRMLHQTCERYGLPVIETEWECAMELYAAARNRWSRKYGFVWCKLGEACWREGVQVEGFHEACADAQATRLLVLAVGGKGSNGSG